MSERSSKNKYTRHYNLTIIYCSQLVPDLLPYLLPYLEPALTNTLYKIRHVLAWRSRMKPKSNIIIMMIMHV